MGWFFETFLCGSLTPGLVSCNSSSRILTIFPQLFEALASEVNFADQERVKENSMKLLL